LPLECFDERANFAGIELLTYGPRDRMRVDGQHFPFDVEFDPSTGSWQELWQRLPSGFDPELLLLWWPDQEPLPADLQRCPVPVVGVVSDYNLTLPYLVGLWPFFDAVLCDRAGVDLFRRLSFAGVRYWNQYAHKRPFHRMFADAGPRAIDVGFAGNLNPVVQRARAPWIERVRALSARGIATEIHSDLRGAAYGRFLSRCKLGWNRSIRGELNLRGFEVPACGALLLVERDNLEVRDFFVPDEECVLYGDRDFEDVVAGLLSDDARRQRIAAAGHRRVQEHALGGRLGRLLHDLGGLERRRPPATDAEAALGRATALLTTWAKGPVAVAAALRAHELQRDDPRALNLLALATLRWRGPAARGEAWNLLVRASEVAKDYLIAPANLCRLAGDDQPGLRAHAADELGRRRATCPDWHALDGPVLPLGFKAQAIDWSWALQDAIRAQCPERLVAALPGGADVNAAR
jgi:hypothetical protein